MTTTDGQGKHHRTGDLRLPSTTQEPEPSPWSVPGDPLPIPPYWALCPLDWLAHAVDAWADHPVGVWIARCGHQLSGGTPLYDLPQGHQCPSWARWSQASELADRAYDTLFRRLHDDLDVLAADLGLRPDLIVVTGDLAEWGLPSELDQVVQFLTALTEAVELPRRHVAIVPGNHDVNRNACAAYFQD
jgi:3',5'-cyclic AMP phosphodiesterase CpdA